MGRKLKYKDVVKKPPSNFTKKVSKRGKNFKKTKERKTFSIYKENHNNKRKHDDATDENNHSKKSKEELEYKLIKQVYEPEPSDSEEEIEENPLKLLRATFGDKIDDSIISSSDTEEEEENIQEDLDADDSAGSGSDTGEELEEPQNSPDSLSEDEEKESDLDIQTEEENLENSLDPFVQHVCYELHPSLLESLEAQPPLVEIHKKTWPRLGNLLIQIPQCSLKENCNNSILDKTTYALPSAVPKKISSKSTPKELHIKSQIVPNLMAANKGLLRQETLFTPLQQEIFSIVNNYQDLLYPERTFDNAQEIRFVYCLHAVNHVLKTRIKVLHHNAKLSKKDDVPEEFRDQGLVRPKILIVAPFKDSAYKIINTIITILFKEDKGNVIKKNRFVEDYTGNELYMPKKNPKPEDYEKTFCGNTGDDFKIGMSVTKKSLKLYSDFYSSDIIVASPLGLRTIIGAEGEPDRDFDFLTSLEILILDQTEIFSMQNWDHIIHLFNHMHLKPKDLHGTDVSRVRQWCLNLWAKYYRQTLIFSSLTTPEINSIFNKKCANFAGKVKVANPIEPGCMSQIFVQLPHVFHKFSANSPADAVERRFNFFVQKVLPQQRDSRMKQTLIYVPSYFDYVKLRNYFKREDIGFVQICEYSKDSKIARARDMFYHGDAHFLLYTERHHFYHRIRIKGVRHLIFYQPPSFPHFYSELSNLMQVALLAPPVPSPPYLLKSFLQSRCLQLKTQDTGLGVLHVREGYDLRKKVVHIINIELHLQEANMNKKVGSMTNMTVTVLYSKYDILQLAAIIGTERATKMLESERDVHMIVTGTE